MVWLVASVVADKQRGESKESQTSECEQLHFYYVARQGELSLVPYDNGHLL
jgi:hypothetical protein